MKQLRLLPGITIPFMVVFMPKEFLPIPEVTIIEQRVLALFLFAMFFWVFEPIPVFATSLLIISIALFSISDKSFLFLQNLHAQPDFGQVLPYREIIGTMASPIIILFLGGFFLAMAATKYRLDINLARVLLKPFGNSPRLVLLGLMLTTAIFSMFMSNTATTAMMLTLLSPILSSLQEEDTGKAAFVLGIPFAANIG
jgi:sodium-dependent dicarboxylate transporter 2/3/5